MNKWTGKWYLVAILIILSMLGYLVWYVSLNSRYVFVFLATTIIALGFVAVMTLLPKYRQRLVKKIIEYHVKEKEMGKELYRYYRVALLVIIVCALVFPIVLQYQLIASQYMAPLCSYLFHRKFNCRHYLYRWFPKSQGQMGATAYRCNIRISFIRHFNRVDD